MLLFSGNYRYSLDEKNRLIVPARFREVLNAEGVDKLYIVKADSYLYVFPFPVFLELTILIRSSSGMMALSTQPPSDLPN